VLLSDVDLLRWRQDLIEDRNRLAAFMPPPGRSTPPGTPSSRRCAT
jgi:hypothetical protein